MAMEDYPGRTRQSKRLYEKAKTIFPGGVNHNARFYEPYPIFVTKAKGQHIWDEDRNRYTDYWMGHMALILGHSPAVVVEAVRNQAGKGTLYGMGSESSVELGEAVVSAVPCAEMLRFCNTGAEATMYLVRLARGYTRKRTIIKMAGGWHGYNTELNKGVHRPFNASESSGILPEEQAHVVNIPFNDVNAAEEAVRKAEGDVAAIFLEPVLGAGGCIPAEKGYLKALRELSDRKGILLAFDEVITGFRLAFGGAQEYYGVTPDIATFGKVAGGGLPLGLVCGRKEILALADPTRRGSFVSIGGGTFSENPLTMAAGLATLTYLRLHSGSVYPALARKGETVRRDVDRAFAESDVETHTTGAASLFLTHFGPRPSNAEESSAGNAALAHEYALSLMSDGVFVLPGHPGGVSTRHTQKDIDWLVSQSHEFGRSVRMKGRK